MPNHLEWLMRRGQGEAVLVLAELDEDRRVVFETSAQDFKRALAMASPFPVGSGILFRGLPVPRMVVDTSTKDDFYDVAMAELDREFPGVRAW